MRFEKNCQVLRSGGIYRNGGMGASAPIKTKNFLEKKSEACEKTHQQTKK
jgi:hypothetical protein